MYPELSALLLADGRLPIGGHAHSAGLEPALRAGLTTDGVPEFLRVRLRSVVLVEAAAAVLARRAATDGHFTLSQVRDAVHARTASAAMRSAAGLLGSGLARLAERLYPEHEAVVALSALGARPPRAVALGVIGAVMGMADEGVARCCLYDDAQTVAAAALKLLPVDPTDTARWVLEAASAIEESVARAVAVNRPAELPAISAPQVEQWSLEHELVRRRLFVA